MPEWLEGADETRLDIDPQHQPHIVASMTALGDIGTFDIVICQHALEHLAAHEVDTAIGEFRRVLNPGGFAYIVVPDLEGVAATEEVLFVSPAGPITGIDLIYGFRPMIQAMPHMQHRCGFIAPTLRKALAAHFERVETKRIGCHNLLGVGIV